MTKHEEAIQQFLADNPKWERFGLRKSLNKALGKGCEFDLYLGFIPDAFEIDAENKIVRLLEVEGSSRVSKKKMNTICQFAFEIDSREWFTELHLISLITGARSKVTDDELTLMALKGIFDAAQRILMDCRDPMLAPANSSYL